MVPGPGVWGRWPGGAWAGVSCRRSRRQRAALPERRARPPGRPRLSSSRFTALGEAESHTGAVVAAASAADAGAGGEDRKLFFRAG